MRDFHPDKVMRTIDLVLQQKNLTKEDILHVYYLKVKLKHFGSICVIEESYLNYLLSLSPLGIKSVLSAN